MKMKLKKIGKWSLIFTLLISYTYFTLFGLLPRFDFVSASSTITIPIYYNTSAGIERASANEIKYLLFYNNLTISREYLEVPTQICDVAAKYEGMTADIRFSTFLANSNIGQGSLSINNEKGRRIFSSNFKIQKILLSNEDRLMFVTDNEVVVYFNKNFKTVSITSEKDNILLRDMPASIIKGCQMETRLIFLINDNGKLLEQRKIEEVRQILKEHPEFIHDYENLNQLFNPIWWANIPPGFNIS